MDYAEFRCDMARRFLDDWDEERTSNMIDAAMEVFDVVSQTMSAQGGGIYIGPKDLAAILDGPVTSMYIGNGTRNLDVHGQTFAAVAALMELLDEGLEDIASAQGVLLFVTIPRRLSMADVLAEVEVVEQAAASQGGESPNVVWGVAFHDEDVVDVCLVAFK
ncbi:FtsZ/tubulin family protein [Bifidobacterium choloepi]|uniref:Uncharacterized protein n=1 Tax=Bifidobacterium choloepi TaxID=2614131 RepID=A0A6I5NCH7_9BIFI|nr:hypothetical protein [Bifidobacterium choloepi]NEG69174.1 hypothetical protein [Bifidobacterium choloepi]